LEILPFSSSGAYLFWEHFGKKWCSHNKYPYFEAPGVAKRESAGQREHRWHIGLSLLFGEKDAPPLFGFPWFP
jgi:hypothetical protein